MEHLVLYSTNTLLAYRISIKYYNKMHYVWCSPFYSHEDIPTKCYNLPPSSSPKNIYNDLKTAVDREDHGSSKIESTKIGILNGVTSKFEEGIITKSEEKEIVEIIEVAHPQDFRPLLYIIPYDGVQNKIERVGLGVRAHPWSPELKIAKLSDDLFDIIEL